MRLLLTLLLTAVASFLICEDASASASQPIISLVFEPNRGQTNNQVKSVARSSGYATFLTWPSQAVLKIRNELGRDDVVTMNLARANARAQSGRIEKIAGEVIVNNNALLFTGNNQFSSPVGPAGGITLTIVDTLDSFYLNTTQSIPYTAVANPAVGYACPGGTAMGQIPPYPTSFGGVNAGFAYGNNGVLPASTSGEPATQVPYNVSVANPGAIPPGTYAETVTVYANTGAQIPPQASMTYCLTVGNVVTVSMASLDNPNQMPPLYIEAGDTQTTTMTVTALGTLVPQAAAPVPVAVPIGIAYTSGPAWVTNGIPTGCAGYAGPTPITCNITSTPPLIWPAGENDPTWTVTATGLPGAANSAVVIPPVPGTTPGASAPFVFRADVTSGLNLFFWTDFSLNSNSATAPANNYVNGPTLVTEAATQHVASFLTEPVFSIANPGSPSPDWPGTGAPIVLQFYTVQNSGVYTMQDGTPALSGNAACDILSLGNPCQNVYVTASGIQPGELPDASLGGPYSYATGPAFLLLNGPIRTNCTNFSTPGMCQLTSVIDTAQANELPLGQYTATYEADFTDANSPNIPEPARVTVEIILTVTPNPTVILTPNPVTFSFNVGCPNTVPASQLLGMQTSAPSGPVGFTLTPTAGTAMVALSVNGATPSTSPVNGCIVANTLQDCKGNPLTIVASIANLASLTFPGAYGANILVNIPAVNSVTGLPNAPVANSSFTVPVNVISDGVPVTIGPSLTFNWTVGNPQNATSPANGSMTIILSCSGSYTVTSSANWVTLGPPQPNNMATVSRVAVSINLANAPTTVGTYVSTITVMGASGESATATVTLIVAAIPTVTLTPPTGTSNPDNFTYYSGSPDPATIPVTVSLTNTPENPTYALTASVNAGAASWCAATNPGNVNNTPGSFTVTLTPKEAGLAVSATPYTCTITVKDSGLTLNTPTFVINLTVSGPTLTSAAPNPVTFFTSVSPASTAIAQTVTLTGTGTYSFPTTPATLTPQPPNSVMWLGATNPAVVTNGTGTMSVTVNGTGLGVGQYVGSIAFQGPAATAFNLPVTLNVAQIGAAPSSLTQFVHYIGYTTPSTQTVVLTAPVTGGGDAHLAFTFAPSAAWIQVTQTARTADVTPATLSITYNPAGLAPSATAYSSSVSVSTTGSTLAPFPIPLSLLVNPQPTLTVLNGGTVIAAAPRNNGVTSLTGCLGGTNPTQTLTVNGAGLPTGGTMPFTASVSSTGNWLQLMSGSSLVNSVTGTTGGTITLVVNLTALVGSNPGIYDGSLTISGPNSANTLNILVALDIIPCVCVLTVSGTTSLSSAGTSTGGVLPETPLTGTISVNPLSVCSKQLRGVLERLVADGYSGYRNDLHLHGAQQPALHGADRHDHGHQFAGRQPGSHYHGSRLHCSGIAQSPDYGSVSEHPGPRSRFHRLHLLGERRQQRHLSGQPGG